MVDHDDESVQIAIRALGDMRNARIASQSTTPNLSSTSTTPTTPSLSSPPDQLPGLNPIVVHPQFVERVSSLPLVNSAIRAYEHGKASSRVVKYGAEMMESSVKTFSRPVIERLPVNVNSLDEFACRQLDRLDRYRRPSPQHDSFPPPSPEANQPLSDPSKVSLLHPPDDRACTPVPSNTDPLSIDMSSEDHLHTSTNSQYCSSTPATVEGPASNNGSRWQTVLSEASGLGAALTLSEDNMRRLRYCLQCLLYATAQIDTQILVLRDFIARLQPLSTDPEPPQSPHSTCTDVASSDLSRTTSSSSLVSMTDSSVSSPSKRISSLLSFHTETAAAAALSAAHLRTLTDARRDIVHTIRHAVDVVSKYAGGALPEPARARVRGFILTLPQRWASRMPSASPPVLVDESLSVRDVREGREREREERESVRAAAAGGGTGARRVGRSSRRLHSQREQRSATASDTISPTSPEQSRPVSPMPSAPSTVGVHPGTAVVAAQRILTLATESLDMMRGVTAVVRDSLDKADAWVGRLRAVGIQRQGSSDGSMAVDDPLPAFGPHPETSLPSLDDTSSPEDFPTLKSTTSDDISEDFVSNSNAIRRGSSSAMLIHRQRSVCSASCHAVSSAAPSNVLSSGTYVLSTVGSLTEDADIEVPADMHVEGETSRMGARKSTSRRGSLSASTSVTDYVLMTVGALPVVTEEHGDKRSPIPGHRLPLQMGCQDNVKSPKTVTMEVDI